VRPASVDSNFPLARHRVPGRLTAPWRAVVLALAVLASVLSGAVPCAASAGDGDVLFLSSTSPTIRWTEAMFGAIDDEVTAAGKTVNLYFEFLNRSRLPETPSDEEWAAFLATKYRAAPPKVIIADGPPAIRFAAEFGRRIFGDAPLIGILPNFDSLGDAAKAVTVRVTTGPHIHQTVDMALSQWPDARKAVIVSDDSPLSHHLATVIRAAFAGKSGHDVRVEHLYDFRLEDLDATLAALPTDSIVIYTHVSIDSTGRHVRPDVVAAQVAKASAAPVYVLFEDSVGTGVVGGYVNDPRVAGRVAIRAAMNLLDGDSSPPAADERHYSTRAVVDWRQLRRWGIDERTLPAGADIRFRRPSLFEAYFREAVTALAFIGLLSAALGLIFVLYVQRGRLALALRDANSRLEERVAARTRDLERALAEEQRVRRHLRTFIEMATHEFKTPLAVIDSAAQVLELLVDSGREEVGSRIAVIRRSVRRVVDLIETCLTGERYEQLSAHVLPFDPAQMIERVAERHRSADAGFLVTDTGDLPPEVIADPELLGIALDALIDNARRYARTGGPIEVAARREGAAIVFTVGDRGPGVPPDQVERIFEKYFRGTGNGGAPGTGIGLHLVKTIAELHCGTARYRPRPGGGALFLLTIPLGRIDIPEPATEAAAAGTPMQT